MLNRPVRICGASVKRTSTSFVRQSNIPVFSVTGANPVVWVRIRHDNGRLLTPWEDYHVILLRIDKNGTSWVYDFDIPSDGEQPPPNAFPLDFEWYANTGCQLLLLGISSNEKMEPLEDRQVKLEQLKEKEYGGVCEESHFFHLFGLK
ncbi:hypothetical protein PROFUN_04720 [Planoprotostelium fungivorum]|uniref:Uncharacterized protein n=1 Tax=Planoprotostelium fungivorum TaxID=1890364 RepID=A0A2P6NFW7_9EUKA|nr:hypothetical protein PROFUN_04720 [Planoprotostelium fungivorum]